MRLRRCPVSIILMLMAATACGSSVHRTTAAPTTSSPTSTVQPAAVPATVAAVPALPADAYVRVAVAGLWHSPESARPVDRAAIAAPVDVRAWLAAMTLSDRRGLQGRLDSQLLLGDRAVVLEIRNGWAHVVVPEQPTPLDHRGYPGWIPTDQLTFSQPAQAPFDATVVQPTAWLYDADGQRVMEISMGTRLPVRHADDSGWVAVTDADGRSLRLRTADVSITPPGTPALAATTDDLVRVANLFLGLPYLWAGTTGFGFDCSGLMQLNFRVHGISIARDADAEATAGTPVARSQLRTGDLVFFANRSGVHHVGMYLTGGSMIESPETGRTVDVVPVTSPPYAVEYAGARRYLP